MKADDITIHQELQAPIDLVWRAWTDGLQAGKWFAAGANIQSERGSAYELFWDPNHPERNSTIGCRVTFIQPMEWLGFTWRGPTFYDDLMNENASPPPPPTHVTARFTARNGSTELLITHTGWGAGPKWMEAREWHIRAWGAVVENLKAFLEGRELPFIWERMIQDYPSAQTRQSPHTAASLDAF